MSKQTNANQIINFLQMLFILFLGLKLGNVITWSWWWVFAPLWIPALIALLIFIGAVIYAAMEPKNGKPKK